MSTALIQKSLKPKLKTGTTLTSQFQYWNDPYVIICSITPRPGNPPLTPYGTRLSLHHIYAFCWDSFTLWATAVITLVWNQHRNISACKGNVRVGRTIDPLDSNPPPPKGYWRFGYATVTVPFGGSGLGPKKIEHIISEYGKSLWIFKFKHSQ